MTKKAEPLTVKAVVKHAKALQERAYRIGTQDPYRREKVYYPTTASAYKVFETNLRAVLLEFDAPDGKDDPEMIAEAARRAIYWFDQRVALDEHETREHDLEAKRSRQRHKRRAVEGLRDRQARRAGRTPGQRIDAALAELSVIAAVKAVPLDTDRVSGSRSDSQPHFPGDPRARVAHEVIKIVRLAEDQVEEWRRRRVEAQRDIA